MNQPRRCVLFAVLVLIGIPAAALGANGQAPDLSLWSAAPFAVLLLCIALLPLTVGHWWHRHRNKGFVAAVLAVPTALYLIAVQLTSGQHTLEPLADKVLEYISFIILLGSLYTVAGGIVLTGDLPARRWSNTAVLGVGAVLANLIGTTGASMLLIRPMLRINAARRACVHVPIFFILVVSNTGGLLTPLGDPPLFLGFLNGVPFFWTLQLWPQWLLVNGTILAVFFVWDTLAFRNEQGAVAAFPRPREPLRLAGWINVLFLAGILAAVLLQGTMTGFIREIVPAGLMLAMGLLSLAKTSKELRKANGFTWEPIIEVAVLFAGIFVTMVPALAILEARGSALSVRQPWQFLWLTGLLSGFLDNAPTYLTFATLAAGPHHIEWLVEHDAAQLQAISCGAVFLGALTYIGNGPNFMVKAIADEAGYQMPSFFGYLAYSCLVLLPVLALVTLLFFRPV
jgi:Na+/H+ antiporter NhaD/arsenite permease-like protein